jgi:hypothetical protein
MTAVDAYTRDVLMEAECVRERNGVWHIVLGDGNADFQPILCGEQVGMGVHGHAPPVEWHWRNVRVAEVAFDEEE